MCVVSESRVQMLVRVDCAYRICTHKHTRAQTHTHTHTPDAEEVLATPACCCCFHTAPPCTSAVLKPLSMLYHTRGTKSAPNARIKSRRCRCPGKASSWLSSKQRTVPPCECKLCYVVRGTKTKRISSKRCCCPGRASNTIASNNMHMHTRTNKHTCMHAAQEEAYSAGVRVDALAADKGRRLATSCCRSCLPGRSKIWMTCVGLIACVRLIVCVSVCVCVRAS